MVAWSRSVHGFHQQDLQLGWAQATYRGLGWWPQKTAKELPFRPQVNEYFAYFRISKFPVFSGDPSGRWTYCMLRVSFLRQQREVPVRLNRVLLSCALPAFSLHGWNCMQSCTRGCRSTYGLLYSAYSYMYTWYTRSKPAKHNRAHQRRGYE